jgi:hypothetical protein
MTTDQIRAEYLDAISTVGEDVVIRTYMGTSETYDDKTVRARVVEFNPDQLVGAIVQGDRKLIMLATDVDGTGVTLALTTNCKILVRGKELQVKSIDDNTRRVQGDLIAYELVVGG